MPRTLRRASVASSALLLRFSLAHRALQRSSTPLGKRGGRTHGAIQKFCFDIPPMPLFVLPKSTNGARGSQKKSTLF
jgi:hypothetical protein